MTDSTNTVYQTALSYAQHGIYVNPVKVVRKPDGKKDVQPVGRWRDTSSNRPADIAAWWMDAPGLGVLIDTGKSELVVIDPDGADGIAAWLALDPPATARARTPGGGEHWYYRAHPRHVIGNDQSGKIAPSVDVRGLGGFVIAPPSQDGTGAWQWIDGEPDWASLPTVPDLVIELMNRKTESAPVPVATAEGEPVFDVAARQFTEAQATEFIRTARLELEKVRSGYNGAINNFAMACAHFPWLVDRDRCARVMIKTLRPATGWTAPDADDIATINSAYSATEAGRSWTAARVEGSVDTSARADKGLPRLHVTSTADMTYWLAQEIGADRLSGFFLRDSRLVHTPRVNEIGYVPGPDSGDNGPAEIRPVTAEEAAAKIQFLYACFKVSKEEGEKAALFPVDAARRVVNAPEAATGLRPLRGITLTPMIRSDGSLLAEPGYDKESGYLFLPGPGVNVPEVSAAPTAAEVSAARKILLEMVAGFPFVGDDDRVNYLGALLTPMLRLVCPPPYKLIGIGAHQPASGKTLLAQTISIVHGGVLRSEVPEDEAEWRKMTMSLLATTSAPVAVLDNVTGVLRSSVLAGLLTARGEIQDRELGSSRMIRTENDRLWVITGNNLSLGGDLVRRTVTVMIDPDMANPETRTGFAIQDLTGWVTERRNQLLHALLTLIQHWVYTGRPLEDRAQSDGYAEWEKAVGGILAVAGFEGRFDAESGKRAARGGDDDGLARVLESLRDRFEGRTWSVAEALAAEMDHGDFMVERSRDWLPAVIVDKIERSPAAGRISFGRWLQFRDGRWVRTEDGRNLVIRSAPHENRVARWRIEER